LQLLIRRLPAPPHKVIAMPSSRPVDTAALFAAHHAAVFRAAFRITGQAEDAEDVLQTVFLQLVRGAGVATIENPGGYLHRLAVNAALNLLRRRRRRPAVPLEDVMPGRSAGPGELGTSRHRGGAAAVGDSVGDPSSHELRERLRAALAILPPRAAEIFALRYIEGYSNRQIAVLLDTSESSIGVTLHRTRQRLRSALADVAPF